MARPVLRGVVFDLDGTLTVPNLDFKEMYRRCGVPLKDDIIQVVNKMPKAEKEAAWNTIYDMEAEGEGRICSSVQLRQVFARLYNSRHKSHRTIAWLADTIRKT
jgi:phosphoglycolate phosphatase-like HAD superfamily hydrolase